MNICSSVRPARLPARRSARRRSRGFSLVEILVALIVSSIGLLGLAKMEALALASTDVAGTRSLAAIQASSLAAMMHADRAYWGAGLAAGTTTVQVTSGAVAVSNTALQGSYTCTTAGSTACTPTQMAARDIQTWGQALQALLPGYLATITCTTAGFPVSCTVQIQWAENGVAILSQQSNIASLAQPTYTVYIEP
jgi:type IV pilus assembly protein PilV